MYSIGSELAVSRYARGEGPAAAVGGLTACGVRGLAPGRGRGCGAGDIGSCIRIRLRGPLLKIGCAGGLRYRHKTGANAALVYGICTRSCRGSR